MNKNNIKTLSQDEINRREHYEELVKLMPFKDKVEWAKKRIKEFLNECEKDQSIKEITVSFSGGKDSTVLLDLVLKTHQQIKCKIPIVMVYATEITFPSTFKFIEDINRKYQKEYEYLKNVQIVKPKKTWMEILSQNGYPIYSKQVSTLINRVKKSKTKNNLTKWFFGIDIKNTSTAKFRLSKNRLFLLDDMMLYNWPKLNKQQKEYFKKYNEKYFFSEKCCDFIKGNLKHDKRPSFIGTMAQESELRKKSWIKAGCNIFNKTGYKSRPLSIWTTKDIWQYISEYKLEINPAYGYVKTKKYNEQNLRFERLGCTSCPYGSFMEQKAIRKLIKEKYNINNYKTMNRFEILKEEYPNLYLSQVIYNGMYKILIDMGIEIKSDKMYMQLFKQRHNQITKWYENERTNILRVMAQIENHNDYKQKGKTHIWSYTLNEYKQAMNYFGFDTIDKNELSELRKNVKLESYQINNK